MLHPPWLLITVADVLVAADWYDDIGKYGEAMHLRLLVAKPAESSIWTMTRYKARSWSRSRSWTMAGSKAWSMSKSRSKSWTMAESGS